MTARTASLALGKIPKWLDGRVILEIELKYGRVFSKVFAQSPLLPCILHTVKWQVDLTEQSRLMVNSLLISKRFMLLLFCNLL